MVGRASASSTGSPATPGLMAHARAKRKRLIHRKKVGTGTGAASSTTTTTTRAAATATAAATTTRTTRRRKISDVASNATGSGALMFSPMRTRASALAHHVHHARHHHTVHSSPILTRRSRGDILRPSPKARKLDHVLPPSSTEWSTGSESDCTFPPSATGSPVRRGPRQHLTRRTRLQPAETIDELNGLDLEGLNLTDKEIHPSKLEKLEKIGSGGFKDVYVGKYQISKTRVNKVAIADIRDQLTEMDIKELSLLRDLKHENIVRFIGVSIPGEPKAVPVMIVSELCVNGDLFDYIRSTSAPADDEIFRIMLETARGLAYLHTRKPAIIHRDVKSTNVLITRNRTVKINDFGFARVKNSTRSVVRSIVGTVNWQAAELWVPKPHYNEKVDVWSAAMTFWEALQWHQSEKRYPFQGMNEHQIYLDVGQKRLRPYTGAIRRQFGDDVVELLDRMWHHSPRERPTMTEVCEELEVLIAQKRSVTASTKRSR
ncbi:hypothetical protein A4X09_0g5181 [Tilletia walkeri]|uniref:Protein kinase domain-containing protein n=1 Tax=Tilletia walkeri TaxID=117179 RepID=A0A8X7T353_9BASI|nr:hypothetical protein A4X09_0g5181 [Tilletia walkeri]